jgi:peptide/nickel transport system substrate-binding protein
MRAAILCLGAILVSACGSPAPQATTSGGATTAPSTPAAAAPASGPKTLTISQSADPPTLDPAGDSARFSLNVSRQAFEGLIEQDSTAQLHPALATSWQSVDLNTWEFKLRQGVKFHDGSPFTADDVKFSFERILNPENKLPVRAAIANIKSVTVVDPMTVRIQTSEPDTILPLRISHSSMIVPMKTFQTMGAEKFAENPIGTGPYKFVQWVRGEKIVYAANQEWWGGKVNIDQLVWKNIAETSTRMAALKTGDVDIASQVPLQEVASINGDANLRVSTVAGNIVDFWLMNTTRPPLDNVKVRQAINYAIDKEGIAKNIYGSANLSLLGNAKTIYGLDPAQSPYPYDPAKAKALLAEAGYPNGLEVPINAATSGMTADDKSNLQTTIAQLGAVGIKATPVTTLDFATVLSKWRAAELSGMSLFDYGYSIPHIDVMLATYLDSTRAPKLYLNKSFEEAVATARGTFDKDQQLAMYKQIQQQLKDDAALGFLYTENVSTGVNKRVKGYESWPNDWIYVHYLDV